MTRAFFLVLLPLVVACSSGGSGGGGGFIDRYCDAFAPCCAKLGKPADGNTCRQIYGAFTAGSGYDAAKGEKCLAEINAIKNDPTFCDSTSNDKAPSCKGVFSSSSSPSGVAKPGEACTNDSDCAPSSKGKVHCATQFTMSATTKKCQVVIVGKAGDTPCVATIDGIGTSYNVGSDALPAEGFSCDKASNIRCDGTTDKCVALAAIGEPCTSSSACVVDAICDFPTDKCIARKKPGEACSGFDECVTGAWCDSMGTKTCKQKLPNGAKCTVSAECASSSCTNGSCESDDLGFSLMCGGN